METFIIAFFSLFVGAIILFYIIKGAIKEAVDERMSPFLKLYSAVLRHQAKQQGMTDEEIDKAWMTEKMWIKKYKK